MVLILLNNFKNNNIFKLILINWYLFTFLILKSIHFNHYFLNINNILTYKVNYKI